MVSHKGGIAQNVGALEQGAEENLYQKSGRDRILENIFH
jgi:hypothetical protein